MLETRLRNQRLTRTTFRRPDQVVAWLGVVQAQAYPSAAWGVALRARNVTEAAVEQALDEGSILRTHVLRPTWHFVTPDDIRWMQTLTASRRKRNMTYYDRQLEIDARTATRARTLIERALEGGRHRTRGELAEVLRRGKIEATGQRLAHLVMHAEFDAAICSGPRRGKHFTYALVAERAPQARTLSRDEALAELARRYFRSHGPATVHDFAWWSGLAMADARAGASYVPRGLVLSAPPTLETVAGAHYLLPNHDEYLIAYKNRGAVIDPERVRNLGVFTSVEYPHHVVLAGRVAGSWQRRVGTQSATVAFRFYVRPTARERTALAAQVERFGRMLGMPCRIDD